jgi:hypothetical protein
MSNQVFTPGQQNDIPVNAPIPSGSVPAGSTSSAPNLVQAIPPGAGPNLATISATNPTHGGSGNGQEQLTSGQIAAQARVPSWAWVLAGVLGLGLVGAIVWFVTKDPAPAAGASEPQENPLRHRRRPGRGRRRARR